MKTRKLRRFAGTVVTFLVFGMPKTGLLAQGVLTPPGPPAPTMRTLTQVEPRTPISTAPVTISNSGSYYLTTNLTVATGTAITIAANGVTLDLNGFTIGSTAPSAIGYGIHLENGVQNVSIYNGHIRGMATNDAQGNFGGGGFSFGIAYSGAQPTNVLVWRVSVSQCLGSGINLGITAPTRAEDCQVQTVAGIGISANVVRGCVAMGCGGDGIYADVVSDSRGQSIGNGSGVRAVSCAMNCSGLAISGNGINAETAQNCWGISGTGDGVHAVMALNCSGSSSSGNGITAGATAQNCYGSARGSGTGVYAADALNCYGYASGDGTGLFAVRTASGCYGSSANGTGLRAQNAAFCVGNRVAGRAIEATIANGCYAGTGTNLITFKYNMP